MVDEPETLFGSSGAACDRVVFDGCVSAPFVVGDHPVVVRAFGLTEDSKVFVESVAGNNDGEFFEPLTVGCGCCVAMTACNPTIILPVSGRYRLNRCVCDEEPSAPLAHVEYQAITTGAVVNYGEVNMACGCDSGSQVSVVSNPDGSVTIVVDGVPTTIPASSQVAAVDAGGTVILTVDGNTYQIDSGPDVPYVNSIGVAIPEGACLVTCEDLVAALANVSENLVDANGGAIPDGGCVVTCADLTAAIAALPSYVDPAGAPIGDGDAVVTPTTLVNVADGIAAALAFDSCAGTPVTVGTAIATCEDLAAAAVNVSLANNNDGTYSLTVEDSTICVPACEGLQTVSPTASANSLVPGFAEGIVDKADTLAAPIADITGADTGLAVAYSSMPALFSNAAAEGLPSGMMNSDGSLGWFTRRVTVTGAGTGNQMTERQTNGAWYRITAASGAGFVLPEAVYPGQTMYLSGVYSPRTYTVESKTGASVRGRARWTRIGGAAQSATPPVTNTGTTTDNEFTLNQGDMYFLLCVLPGVWEIYPLSIAPYIGTNWHEESDGTISVWGASPYNPAAFPAFATPPVIVDDGTNFTGKGATT